MKRAAIFIALFGILLSAKAEIEILYLSPSNNAPVLGSVSTDSKLYRSATPVEGKEPWMQIERKDYFSGFIAKDSLTPNGKVEMGTSVLLTPSKSGKVLTTVNPGDEVTVNLVDDWTEITIYKTVPGYFIPADAKPTPPTSLGGNTISGSSRITYANDPLLQQVRTTRYTPPPVSNPGAADSLPIAARATTPSAVPLTGFEEADNLNPVYGRTAPDGSSRGYTLGAGSTPMPQNTAAPYLDAPLQAPTSIARIPEPSPSDPDPTIMPPLQATTVDTLQEEETGAIVEAPTEDLEPVEDVAATEAPMMDEAVQEETQDEALAEIEPLPEEADMDSADAEVIPLAPAAVVAGTAAPAASEVVIEEEVIEPEPIEIVETEEDIEVANEVAESIVPGISQPIVENEPPLIPPTDTNRIYVGKMQRTTKGFWGSKPKFDFELVNYSGDRIAYVDISEIPTGSYDKFTDQIVQVYGTLQPFPDEDVMLIKAANVTLR